MRDNLILRGNTYHVRLALPADVRPFFGNRKLLSQSLKTGLQQEAKDRARAILLDWKNQITLARQTQASQAEQWREELAKVGTLSQRTLTRKVMKAVQGQPSMLERKGSAYIDGLMDSLRPVYEQFAAELREDGIWDELISSILDTTTAQLSTSGLESIPMIQNTTALINKARVQAASNRYQLTSSEQAEASSILANPKTYKPKSPISKTMLDSWAIHLATQIKTEKTRDRLKQSVQRFSDYLTSEGKPLVFDTVHSFLGTLPAAKQTRANYLWAGRTFWKWANKYQPAFRDQYGKAPCPFDGHELPKTGEAAGRKRAAYTKAEIERLYHKAAETDIQLANLIQFGAYTGARLEEIGRIRPEDTIFNASGEPIGFKIYEAKTDAGVRDVPLHTALIPLFKALSSNADANDGYLFPGGKNKYANRLDYLSKRFGRLKTAEGFGKDHTFHSLRHSFTTLLHQLGVSIEILPYITGHETGSFTLSQYSKGPSLAQKSEAVQKLTFSFC